MKFDKFDRLTIILGVITMSPIVNLLGLEKPFSMVVGQSLIQDPLASIFVNHWSVLAGCFGFLICYTVWNTKIRPAVFFAAMIQKMGLFILVTSNWNATGMQVLHPAAIFDGLCSLIFAVYLIQNRKKSIS